ncbi:MAG: hypothetical protein NTZ12_07725 [Candidatus Aminicenantes bacterium]|nr:hypothetical protein [Candidatus Aminicenantes bacterium]
MNIKKNKSAILVLIIAFSWVVLAPAPVVAVADAKKEASVAAAIESPPVSVEMEKEPGSKVSRHRKFPWLLTIAGVVAVGLVVLYFWGTHEQWPQYADDPAIFTMFIDDPAGDQILAPEGGPPQVNPFPPIDLKKISLGVRDDYFYLRVDVAGQIPNSSQKINGDKLKKQAFNLAVDSDNNPGSGMYDGSDIIFHVSFDYGFRSESPYAWCEFSGEDADSGQRKIGGERRSGGPGYDFFVFRYKISKLAGYFPRGGMTMLQSWSEVMSTQYHHFAFDNIQPLHWTIPL